MIRRLFCIGLMTAGLAMMSALVTAAVRQVSILAMDGQFIGVSEWPIVSLNTAFTNGAGQPGFTGTADVSGTARGFVWVDTGAVLRAWDIVSPELTSFEATMGIGDGGKYVFSPSSGGQDSLWTHMGQFIIQGMPAPGQPAGSKITFSSRPSMLPNGTVYWISGIDTTDDGLSDGRILYRCTDVTNPALSLPILKTGGLVGGIPIDDPDGLIFDYKISDDEAHHIHLIRLNTGNLNNDAIVWRDGAIVAREGSPTGDGDNWVSFNIPAINNDGNHVFAATTNGAAASNAVLAFNGAVALREGATVDGVTLSNGSFVEAASINNQGIASFVWILGGIPTEHLFVGVGEFMGDSKNILSTGDTLDVDNDGDVEWTVTNLTPVPALPGMDLAENNNVFYEVEIEPIDPPGPAREAIVAVPIPVSVELTMTVRLFNPGDTCGDTCGSDTELTIDEGQTVEICYHITNMGVIPLKFHDLTDSQLGPVLINFSYTLMPGASAFLTQCDTPAETTTYTGQWSAELITGTTGNVSADDSDSVTVTVNPGAGTSWLAR